MAATPSPGGGGAPGRDVGALLARAALVAVLLGTALLVDVRAEASFDAPKRLAAFLGIGVAAAALLAFPGSRPLRPWTALDRTRRAIAGLVVAALLGALVAALLSPRATVSLHAWRTVAVFALLLPIGASRALDGGGAAILVAASLAGAAVDSILSVLERAGAIELFRVASVAGRSGTGALIGNEGGLALLLALTAVAAFGAAARARATRTRATAGGALCILLAGLAANPGLTALLAFAGGAAVVSFACWGRRAAVAVVALAVGLAGIVAAAPPLRARAADAVTRARAGDWDALLTYRAGPWAAALEMIRERPVTGFGPGAFGAEFVPHRLRAEIRHGRRLVIPRETSSYAEAHSDYLQALAEGGLASAAAAFAAVALLAVALARRIGGGPAEDSGEAAVVLGLLAAGAIAALTWFPLQSAATAVPLLLALGRGWSLLGEPRGARRTDASADAAPPAPPAAGTRSEEAMAGGTSTVAGPTPPRPGAARIVAAALVLGVAILPEPGRYAAELRLRRATGTLMDVLRDGSLPAERRTRALERVIDDANASAGPLAGDPRPVIAAGSAELALGRTDRALERYRAALALGERAEIDLNVGRAFAVRDERPQAFAAFVRTAWLSPSLVPAMPVAAQSLARAEVARLERRLAEGRLAEPPPLPAFDAAPARPADPGA